MNEKVLPRIEIDPDSGFCFGVVNAIRAAEHGLQQENSVLYSLGDIVHNADEVARLEQQGLRTIQYDTYNTLKGGRVLLRAHGEPPAIYDTARRHGITLIDATCPVVLALQKRIRHAYETSSENTQIVIYGQRGHAEVNGLVGQTDGVALVLENAEEIDQIDPARPVILFSQTTKSLDGFHRLAGLIHRHLLPSVAFAQHDTICRQVSNRIPRITDFAAAHDRVFFVAGRKSSNGKVLFAHCLAGNPRTVFVSGVDEITAEMLHATDDGCQTGCVKSIGICGATSTPRSQMDAVADRIRRLLSAD